MRWPLITFFQCSSRAVVRASTLSNMNISETSWPIAIKFYMKHHCGGGLTALGFEAARIRTLVSMATDSSHRVIEWGKCCQHSSGFIFVWIFFILAGNEDNHKISHEFDFRPDSTSDCGVSCP